MNNRHLNLSLAVALAMVSPCALALGLGQLQVKSGLYQPLVAEIPIISATPGELDRLDVRLASPEAFSRVGLDRPGELTANLQFSVGKNASGQPVIRITTPGRFSEPFLSFLIEADWGKGAVTREYTALIDPPYIAPAVIQPMITPSIAAAPAPIAPPVAVIAAPAPVEAPPEPAPEPVRALPVSEPQPVAAIPAPEPPAPAPEPPVPAAEPPPRPQASTPPPRRPVPRPAPAPAPPAPATPAEPGKIGPVASGQTLWSIAKSVRPDPAVSVNQMMLALLRANPDAFGNDNINLLKRGAVLRIPDQDEVGRLSPEAAAALVSQQAIAWRSPRQPVPQPEDNGARPATAAAAPEPKPAAPRIAAARPARPSSRLEITPPAGNKAARGAQSGAAAGAGGTELRAELAQAREDLAARTSEVTELKSRVADLEKQDGDRQRLIEMQNSQLKELQDRLKQMEAQQAAGASAAAASASAVPAATVDASAASNGPVAPAAGATEKPQEAAQAPPTAAGKPWYLDPMVLAGGLLLVLGGMVLALRRAKPKPDDGEAPRRLSDDDALRASMAKTREASQKIVPPPAPPAPPVPPAPVVPVVVAPVVVAPVPKAKPGDANDLALDALKEAVRSRPKDLEAHLSLLRLYHSRGNAADYEIAAQAMRAQLPSTMDPRWREAVIMGASLLPGQALFSQAGWNSPRFNEPEVAAAKPTGPPAPQAVAPAASARAAAPAVAAPAVAAPAVAARAATPVRVFEKPEEEVIDMTEVRAPSAPPVAAAPVQSVASIAMDENPFGDFSAPNNDIHRSEAQMVIEDEASATRIELAKAYLAIGDLEGARSMLEEVLAEGGPTAQSEAARILKEIG